MVGIGLGLGLGLNRAAAQPKRDIEKLDYELVIAGEILESTGATNEGSLIRALQTPWLEIFKQLKLEPDLLFQFSQSPTKFEEFIAASYEIAGWERVTLTPRSGDGGRDVIAEKRGFGSLRFVDQCKAFSKGNLVGHNDVRAMIGVLSTDHSANKALISTTSDFAPGVATDQGIQSLVPNRLELRNGESLLRWLDNVAEAANKDD